MASPSGARSTGQKKVVTYGALSRRKPVSTAKPSMDSNSPGVRQAQPISGRAGNGEDGRKRNHAAAFGVKGGQMQSPSSKPEGIIRSRPGGEGTVGGGSSRKLNGSPVHHENNSASRVHSAAAGPGSAGERSTELPSTKDVTPTKPRTTGVSTPPTARRRRLIDALAAQQDTTLEEEQDTSEAASPSVAHRSAADRDSRLQESDRRSGTPTSSRIKFTYSQTRSTLSESQKQDDVAEMPLLGGEEDGNLSEAHGPSSPLAPPSFGFDDLPDDDEGQPAIKSVHELRRAGANHRFSDEMDDLLGRIGKPEQPPQTMRRNALCELAHKLQRESFAVKFRDHPSRDNVARGVGQERDTTSGFALAAAFIVLLDRGPAPHLERQLCEEGLGKLLGRLLRQDEDIDAIALQRNSNLSGVTRAAVGEVKNDLLEMPIWHGTPPRQLAPRTLSLRLLGTLSKCSENTRLRQIMGGVEQELIAVAAEFAESEELCNDVDYRLLLHCLETLSSAGIMPGSGDAETRLSQHPASIARFLSRAVEQWPETRGESQDAALKLAINTTNTEYGARLFNDSKLLSQLAERVMVGIVKAQQAVGSGPLESDMYDGLLLILGLMINIVEHCPSARSSVDDGSLDGLVRVWRDNQRGLREADSVDKSKLSVAVEYLSVFLGYLCLSRPGRERMESIDGIRGLIGSIRDFAAMHKAVDSKAHELEMLVSDLRRLTHSR